MILTKTFLKQNLIVPQIKERNKNTYLRTKIPRAKVTWIKVEALT